MLQNLDPIVAAGSFTSRSSRGQRLKIPTTRETPISPPLPEFLETWARGIRTRACRPAPDTLELANYICQAREALRPSRNWTALWKSPDMPFSLSAAGDYVVIGRKLGDLANTRTSGCLPGGWNILRQLARLDRQTLLRLIEEQKIDQHLTLTQAKALVARFCPATKEKSRVHSKMRGRFIRFDRFLHEASLVWSDSDRTLANSYVEKWREHLGSLCSPNPQT